MKRALNLAWYLGITAIALWSSGIIPAIAARPLADSRSFLTDMYLFPSIEQDPAGLICVRSPVPSFSIGGRNPPNPCNGAGYGPGCRVLDD